MFDNMNNFFYVDYYGETHYFKDCLYEFVMNLDRNISVVKSDGKFYFFSKGFNKIMTKSTDDSFFIYRGIPLVFKSVEEALNYYNTKLYKN